MDTATAQVCEPLALGGNKSPMTKGERPVSGVLIAEPRKSALEVAGSKRKESNEQLREVRDLGHLDGVVGEAVFGIGLRTWAIHCLQSMAHLRAQFTLTITV